MNKIKLFVAIFLCILFIPFMVDAKEYCKVVSGNGKDIGSEVACGSEHFYIIDSNENEVKMLAKNNLYAGLITYKEEIDMSNETRTIQEVYQDLISEKKAATPGNPSFVTPFPMGCLETDRENIYECYYNHMLFFTPTGELPDGGKSIDSYGFLPIKEVTQKEEAKSAHSDPNNKEALGFPQVGDVYIQFSQMNLVSDNEEEYGDSFRDFTFINFYNPNDSSAFSVNGSGPLSEAPIIMGLYRKYLEDNSYSVNNIDLLSLSDVNNIIKKTNNKSLPIREWTTDPTQTSIFGGLKYDFLTDYLKASESWLYDGTYWLKTAVVDNNLTPPIQGALFIDSLGAICGSGIKNIPCTQYYQTGLPAGVRPTITIPAKELQYLIKTEASDGGSISVVDNSLGGETITFDVSTNKGFKLKGLILRTDSGEEVEFSEEDLTYNDDGTVTISKNKFIMPFENVTIEAKWEAESLLVNPKTGRKIFIFLGLLLGVVFVVKNVILKKKENV